MHAGERHQAARAGIRRSRLQAVTALPARPVGGAVIDRFLAGGAGILSGSARIINRFLARRAGLAVNVSELAFPANDLAQRGLLLWRQSSIQRRGFVVGRTFPFGAFFSVGVTGA